MESQDTSEFCKKLTSVVRSRQRAAMDDYQRKASLLCNILRGNKPKEPNHD